MIIYFINIFLLIFYYLLIYLYSYRSIDNTRFEGTPFFLLCIAFGNTVIALLVLKMFGNNRTIRVGDLWKYAPSAFSSFGATFFSNEALKVSNTTIVYLYKKNYSFK